ncbi:LPP20 family lipoprotein [Marinomonas sp. C2222]|uniref:LPP20 family lipoprotein n=1 Tax=Marinomonas sargassi TaxID=2984494 RepID=A0ABT2YUA4_9GAMM|nr:LPP20 family lipoprotein [Marinomonas sargassi]MCV2403476.1 LPP20 family lipoprotein [Marinomonas sargassi]
MTVFFRLIFVVLGAVILSGCQNLNQTGTTSAVSAECTTVAPCNGNTTDFNQSTPTPVFTQNTGSVNTASTIAVIKQEPIVVTATGYAALTTNKRLSKSQARILTLRSSMLDAYRNLSERVYGLKIDGSSSLRNMVIENDELRTYVDAYLVGAKVVSQREHEDGTFETVVEMALQENFRQCITSSAGVSADPNCQITPGYRAINVESAAPTTNFYSIE